MLRCTRAWVLETGGCASALHALMTENLRAVIPLTAVSGSFKHSLQTKAERCFREYHPRSRWIVQAQPAGEGRSLLPGIPPTEVSGSFKSSLHRGALEVPVFPLFLAARGERDNQILRVGPPPL